jgi:DNA-directed RNA polymerase subunit RPC12/RpoP
MNGLFEQPFNVQFKCSECNTELEIEDIEEISDTVYVRPCEKCLHKLVKTLIEKSKNALKV